MPHTPFIKILATGIKRMPWTVKASLPFKPTGLNLEDQIQMQPKKLLRKPKRNCMDHLYQFCLKSKNQIAQSIRRMIWSAKVFHKIKRIVPKLEGNYHNLQFLLNRF
jgi:hypothetical protein